MCDYSLEGFANREAKAGDHLVSSPLGHFGSVGFVAPEAPDVAVCMLPGTKVRLGEVPENVRCELRISSGDIARFVQRTLAPNTTGYRDALAFDHHADGVTVLIQDLVNDVTIEVITVPGGGAVEEAPEPAAAERVLEPA